MNLIDGSEMSIARGQNFSGGFESFGCQTYWFHSVSLCVPLCLCGEERSFTTETRRTTEVTQRLAMFQGNPQEILKQNSPVARFVLVFPARAAVVPVFKRLFEMKLHRIDQLVAVALDHHLVSAKV